LSNHLGEIASEYRLLRLRTWTTIRKIERGQYSEDRGIIVTGAARRIGAAVVRAFDAIGARVCAVDLDQERVELVMAETAHPDRHKAISADIGQIAGYDELVGDALSSLGRLDMLVRAAAIMRGRGLIEDVTEDDWDGKLDTNLKATFFLNRAVAQILRAGRRGGRIVNCGSQGWRTGGFGRAGVYVDSKGGVLSLSHALARSLAPDGIIRGRCCLPVQSRRSSLFGNRLLISGTFFIRFPAHG
jgi:NAD(P)-dependent dehydrogenase (short-subunit alcohol dehydrogenase family)